MTSKVDLYLPRDMGTWHFASRVIDGKLAGATITNDDGEVIAIIPRLRTTMRSHWAAYRRAADITLAHNAEVWETEIRNMLADVKPRYGENIFDAMRSTS